MKLTPKSKTIIKIAGSGILGIVLIWIILTMYPFKDVISTFTNFTLNSVVWYLIVSFLIMVCLAIRWKIVLYALGHKVPLHRLFAYRIMGYGVSYITPTAKVGGEPVRAAMLKRDGLSFREGLSSVIVDKTLELSFSLIFFVVGVIFLLLDYALPTGIMVVLVILAIITFYVIWKFYSRMFHGKLVFIHMFRFFGLHKFKFLEKYQKKIMQFERPIIKFYDIRRKEFFLAVIAGVASLTLSIVEYKILLSMLGIDASIGISFLVLSIVGIAFLVPVPMALGSLEAFQASLFSILKLSATSGIGVAVITRSRDLLWVLIAAGISIYMGSFGRLVKKAYDDKPIVHVGLTGKGRYKKVDIQINHPRIKNGKIIEAKETIKQKIYDQKTKMKRPINNIKRKKQNKYFVKNKTNRISQLKNNLKKNLRKMKRY